MQLKVNAELERVRAEKKPTKRGMTWQPIETAPRNGTRILAFGHGTDSCTWPLDKQMPELFCVVWWHEFWADDFEEVSEGSFRKVRKKVFEGWKPIGIQFFKPSYWMPLPEPPKTKPINT